VQRLRVDWSDQPGGACWEEVSLPEPYLHKGEYESPLCAKEGEKRAPSKNEFNESAMMRTSERSILSLHLPERRLQRSSFER